MVIGNICQLTIPYYVVTCCWREMNDAITMLGAGMCRLIPIRYLDEQAPPPDDYAAVRAADRLV